MILTKLDQHVNEMMRTAGKKFHNFGWFRFLIIMQNINMGTNGKRNSRLIPNRYPGNGNAVAIEQLWRREFIKNVLIKCMKTCVCHQTMSVYCGQASQKEELLNMELLIADSDVATVVQ